MMLWSLMGLVAAPARGQSAEPGEVAVEAAWVWPGEEGELGLNQGTIDALRAGCAWWLGIEAPEIEGPLLPSGRMQCVTRAGASKWSVSPLESAGLAHERAEMHRSVLPAAAEPRLVLLEVMLDLNALRRGDPEMAGHGPPARAMDYWKISNAREFMVHVRAAPRPAPLPLVLEVDLTWSSRSEPPEAIRTMRLSQPMGPIESATMTPDGAAWTVSLPLKLRVVIARALGSAIAGRYDDDEFQRQAIRWATAVRDRVTRLEAVLEERIVLSGGGRGVSARIGLIRQGGGRSVASDMAGLQARLREAATAKGLEGGVRLDPDQWLRWSVSEREGETWLTVDLNRSD